MAENFPNLTRDIYFQVQEAEQTPNRINLRNPCQKHIIINLLKTKDKENLKEAREK